MSANWPVNRRRQGRQSLFAAPRQGLKRRPFLGLLPGFAVPPSLSPNRKPSPAPVPLHSRVDQFGVLLGRTRRVHPQGRSMLVMN